MAKKRTKQAKKTKKVKTPARSGTVSVPRSRLQTLLERRKRSKAAKKGWAKRKCKDFKPTSSGTRNRRIQKWVTNPRLTDGIWLRADTSHPDGRVTIDTCIVHEGDISWYTMVGKLYIVSIADVQSKLCAFRWYGPIPAPGVYGMEPVVLA